MSEAGITWADIIREIDSLGTIEERAELLHRRCREVLSIAYCSLLNVALAAAEYVETHSDESYATLVAELDRLKGKPGDGGK